MIIRMAKVQIAGPKNRMEDVMGVLGELEVLQPEAEPAGFIKTTNKHLISSLSKDSRDAAEKTYLLGIREKIQRILSRMPEAVKVEATADEPLLNAVSGLMDQHIEMLDELSKEIEQLGKEHSELSYYGNFFEALAPMAGEMKDSVELEMIGVTLKSQAYAERLGVSIDRLTSGEFQLKTEPKQDGTLIGLIVVPAKHAQKIKSALGSEGIPEYGFSPSFDSMVFPEKAAYIKRRSDEVSRQMYGEIAELDEFSKRWAPIYEGLRKWIVHRLSVLGATASAWQTEFSFFIYGWMPKDKVGVLSELLNGKYGGEVVLDEIGLTKDDYANVPVMIKNPPYFRHYEMLARLLPLPSYASYDPTPFIGVFFPVFFGLILGDAGYGLAMLALAIVMRLAMGGNKTVRDASSIAVACALMSIAAGLLYGEFFGELGRNLFGFEYRIVQRSNAILPMLFFSGAVGMFHILLGLVLDAVSSVKAGRRKKTAYDILSALMVLLAALTIASLLGAAPGIMSRPTILFLIALAPFLFLTGGFLAPLEFLKTVGNIISYVRIMAIGLASVLMARAANDMAGLSGDIAFGVLIAGILHTVNLVLGIFSPAVHSLRLHFVEFFSKFLVTGGRAYRPFKKE